MGKMGRMLSFNRKKDKRASATAASAAPEPPQPVAALLMKMKEHSFGERQSFTLNRTPGKPLGLGLAMDSASDTGGRAVIYAVRPESSANAAGLPSNSFLAAVDGQELVDMSLDQIQKLISEAVPASSASVVRA